MQNQFKLMDVNVLTKINKCTEFLTRYFDWLDYSLTSSLPLTRHILVSSSGDVQTNRCCSTRSCMLKLKTVFLQEAKKEYDIRKDPTQVVVVNN